MISRKCGKSPCLSLLLTCFIRPLYPVLNVGKDKIKRGTVLPLDSYSFLLWTCGDLDGVDPTGRHFYQERRYIPEPIVVTRYLGKDCIETVAVDILKLTKMNWNNLQIYTRLPVTIEFAHSISDIVKQLESYSNVPKDFRYYI